MNSLSVAVCRGCCCGTADKHAEVDHQAHLEMLRTAIRSNNRARLWETNCLGPCDRSNVVVVRSGAVRRWFGPLLTDGETDLLATWVADGCQDEPPSELEHLLFEPQPAEITLSGSDLH